MERLETELAQDVDKSLAALRSDQETISKVTLDLPRTSTANPPISA